MLALVISPTQRDQITEHRPPTGLGVGVVERSPMVTAREICGQLVEWVVDVVAMLVISPGSRGSPHAARTSTIGGNVRMMLRAFPSDGRGARRPRRRASRPRSPTGIRSTRRSGTSVAAGGLEARRTRLAPRPSGEGAVLLRWSRCRGAPATKPRDPSRREASAPPGDPEPASLQAVSRLAARDSHLDHRGEGASIGGGGERRQESQSTASAICRRRWRRVGLVAPIQEISPSTCARKSGWLV